MYPVIRDDLLALPAAGRADLDRDTQSYGSSACGCPASVPWGTCDPEGAIARMNTFADLALRRVAPARFVVAATAAEREAVWRLRARTLIERGWASADAFPDGLERDRFDDRAVLVAGWYGDEITATARLVCPAPGTRLPTEEAFDITAQPAGEIANLDRIMVPRAWSDPAHRMLAALAGYIWQVLREHGYTCVVGPVSPTALRLYRRLGWVGTPLGPPRTYWGAERISCRFCPA